jgi:hypothetical protein
MVQAELSKVHDRIQRAKEVASALGEESLRLMNQARDMRDECARVRGRDTPVSGWRSEKAPATTVEVPLYVDRSAVGVGATEAAAIQSLREHPRLHLRTFRVEGTIGDHLVMARYEAGGLLDCDPLLRTHAELVVALGESFPLGDADDPLPATLDGPPVAVLLTLMRASLITKVEATV